ncbi:MAG TPA: hypothetical protein VGH11_13860 [Jatrophihabitans sp.]|jgi:hypothetical protein
MSPQPRPPADWEDLANGELDSHDETVLAQLAALYTAIDPVPDELVERLQFGITLDALNAELAELQQLPLDAMARSADTSQVKTLTFTSDSMTTMVTISAAGPDRVRIDGWAAPGSGVCVELRQVSMTMTTEADTDGRFVFDDVPHGLTRLVLRDPSSDVRPPVITPAVEI